MAERHGDKGPMFWSWLNWGAALVGAVIIGFLIAWLSGEGAPTGLIFGAVAFVVLIAVLTRYLGPAPDDVAAPVAHGEHHHHVPPAAVARAPAAAPAPAPAAVAPVAPAPAAALYTPPDPAAGGISERVRDAARAAGAAARAALGDDAPAARGDDAAAAGGGERPAFLSAPEGEPDNLMRLKGVGPKFAEVLNANGVYHFHQIAAWGPDEIAWIESNIEGFSGRVVRDDWVGQSKVLAAGGETEHSQRVDRGEST